MQRYLFPPLLRQFETFQHSALMISPIFERRKPQDKQLIVIILGSAFMFLVEMCSLI